LQRRAQLCQTALEFRQARQLRFQRKILWFEIGFHGASLLQLRPMLAEELRHLRSWQTHRRAKNFF
jgi:hypothetical protein